MGDSVLFCHTLSLHVDFSEAYFFHVTITNTSFHVASLIQYGTAPFHKGAHNGYRVGNLHSQWMETIDKMNSWLKQIRCQTQLVVA